MGRASQRVSGRGWHRRERRRGRSPCPAASGGACRGPKTNAPRYRRRRDPLRLLYDVARHDRRTGERLGWAMLRKQLRPNPRLDREPRTPDERLPRLGPACSPEMLRITLAGKSLMELPQKGGLASPKTG